MCYEDTVFELAYSLVGSVRFDDLGHAEAVALGRKLPTGHPVTEFVKSEAERLFDELPPASKSKSILDTVGIPNPAKGRKCRGTKLSALRGAIHVCAEVEVEKARLEKETECLSGQNPLRRTTDVWLPSEGPWYPETVRFGAHEEDLFRLVRDPLAVVSIVEARHSA